MSRCMRSHRLWQPSWGDSLIEIEGVGFTDETTFLLGDVPVDVLSVTPNRAVAMTGASQPGG